MVGVGNQRSWGAFYGDHRFGILLATLVTLLVGSSIMSDLGLPAWWFNGLMALLLLTAIFPLCFERHERIFALAFGIPSVLIAVAGNATSGRSSEGILLVARVCEILFLFGTAGLIVRSMFHSHRFAFDSVFGAICGYLFLGLGWMGIFLLIENFQPGSFQMNETTLSANEPHRPLALIMSYYSFSTLTTVGYGDVMAITPVTRTLAWMEAITGQFFLAVVVAALVNMKGPKSGPASSENSADANNDSVS